MLGATFCLLGVIWFRENIHGGFVLQNESALQSVLAVPWSDSVKVGVAELAGGNVRGIEMRVIGDQDYVEVPPLSGGGIQCSCLKCRKASTLARGQAVPRWGGYNVCGSECRWSCCEVR